jgi:hypothetical protein
MLRTVAILVGAASLCRIGVPSARLPAGPQSSAQTVEEPPASPVKSHHSRRSFRQRPIRLTVLFGSVRRNYGPIYREAEVGWAYRTTLQRTPDFARSSSGGAKVTIGAVKTHRNSRLLEYDWTDPRLPCPLTHTQMPDGPMTEHAFMVAGIFIPTLGCWKITGHYRGEELSYVVWVSK